MELSWFESFIYGIVSGLTEFLPISAEAHTAIYLRLIGAGDYGLLRFMTHMGALLALLITCAPMLSKLNRERKIAAVTKKRRKRAPDTRSLTDIRFLRICVIALIIVFILYPAVHDLHQRLWILAGFLIVNGILLYIPQFLPGANKDSRSLSSLDGMIVGLSGGLGVIPGISRVGLLTSVAQMRGADRRYALDTALLLSIPAIIVLLIIDFFAILTTTVGLTFIAILSCITAGITSFSSAFFGIYMMRFLAVRAGFSGFAYYSWGLALFSFILYLMI
ncbi:MAG: undecaprenyl-diphosphate phosphatase [Oscillospiraceae bacterium]|nr:undecaprenyl-diphosphate phosphatase [Oscillospiraceae bacterium]